jgi:hypothetical protein
MEKPKKEKAVILCGGKDNQSTLSPYLQAHSKGTPHLPGTYR